MPGVTAASAAAAELGVSLTRRGVARSVVFVTPSVGDGEIDGDWAASVLAADTAALYMAAGQASWITSTLLARGMRADTPVALVEEASLSGARAERGVLAHLPQMAATRGAGPSLILIGQVFEVPEEVLDNPRSWAAATPLHQRSASLAVGLG